jgi:hypothetical protein
LDWSIPIDGIAVIVPRAKNRRIHGVFRGFFAILAIPGRNLPKRVGAIPPKVDFACRSISIGEGRAASGAYTTVSFGVVMLTAATP